MIHKFISAITITAFVSAVPMNAIAQVSRVPPADQMQTDKSAPAPAEPSKPQEQSAPTPPANSDMPVDPNAPLPTPEPEPAPAPDPSMPPAPPAPASQADVPVTGAVIYQASPDVAPPPAATEAYPLCSKTVKDSCRNPSEAGGTKKTRKKKK